MKYSYMTLPDDTEITFCDVQEDDSVMVYIETPDENTPREPIHVHVTVCSISPFTEVRGYFA